MGVGEPLVSMEMEDVGLLRTGMDEANLLSVVLVGVGDIGGEASADHTTVLLLIVVVDILLTVIGSNAVGPTVVPGMPPRIPRPETAGQLHERRISVRPRRQPSFLTHAIGASVDRVLTQEKVLLAVVESETDAESKSVRRKRGTFIGQISGMNFRASRPIGPAVDHAPFVGCHQIAVLKMVAWHLILRDLHGLAESHAVGITHRQVLGVDCVARPLGCGRDNDRIDIQLAALVSHVLVGLRPVEPGTRHRVVPIGAEWLDRQDPV